MLLGRKPFPPAMYMARYAGSPALRRMAGRLSPPHGGLLVISPAMALWNREDVMLVKAYIVAGLAFRPWPLLVFRWP